MAISPSKFMSVALVLMLLVVGLAHPDSPVLAQLSNSLQDPGAQPLATTATGLAPKRLPVPEQAAVNEAVTLIHQAFEDDYNRGAENPGPLIQTLLSLSADTEDGTRKYALLVEAERIAANAGDHARLMELIDTRAGQYQIDGLQIRIDRLAELLKSRKSRPDADSLHSLYAFATDTVKRALAQDSLRQAKDAAEVVDAIARATYLLGKSRKDDELTSDGVSKQKESKDLVDFLKRRESLVAGYEAAMKVLESSPDDASANGTVGSYCCFEKSDWERGLPALAKSDRKSLALVASQELQFIAEEDVGASEAFLLANAWWNAADPADDRVLRQARERAAQWYAHALTGLKDPIDRALAQKRAGDAESPRPMNLIDRALAQKRAGEAESPRPTASPAYPDAVPPRPFVDALQSRAAVDASLKWLAIHQLSDGGWSFDMAACPQCRGQCSHSGDTLHCRDRCAATGMALLAFQGRGHTHKKGSFKKEVADGIAFLSRLVVAGGGKAYAESGNLYSQGVASLALAEAYRASGDRRLRAPAQSALAFIMKSQDPRGGGWRYSPGQPGDTSVLGWQISALTTGASADLNVEQATLVKAQGFLDSVASANGERYGYTDNSRASPTLTAVGLLSRMQLGWATDTPAVQQGVQYLARIEPSANLYHDYYVTRVMHRVGGEAWNTWRAQMEPLLLKTQSTRGHEAGSWFEDMNSDMGAGAAGRLYCTVMATLILEYVVP